MTTIERFDYLLKLEHKRELQITSKIGGGELRDSVEFNTRMHGAFTVVGGELKKRRGYNLMEFKVINCEDSAMVAARGGM